MAKKPATSPSAKPAQKAKKTQSKKAAKAKRRTAQYERAAESIRWMMRDEAQQLACDAAEAKTDEKALKLAQKALTFDANCVDALMLIATLTATDNASFTEQVAAAVHAGEVGLGKDFAALRGEFWLYDETRPYMRARAALASLLASAGKLNEAIAHLQEMLELNPNDNQGLRYVLLGHLLTQGLIDSAEALLRRYEDDSSAMWAWGRVLERQLSGDEPAARSALVAARGVNRFAEPYLTGATALPEELPEFYTRGQECEGVVCAVEIGAAWAAHPSAIAWLRAQA